MVILLAFALLIVEKVVADKATDGAGFASVRVFRYRKMNV